ncbi:MAG: ATP-dependent zinc metalloprotease FtsH [Vulcanimicrobiaceae bacterium]
MDPEKRPPAMPQPPRRPSAWWWLLIVVVLLAWNLIAFMTSHSAETVTLPYSTFVQQVNAGDVSAVTISGATITGTLKKAYREKNHAYMTFSTAYPAEVGDRGLLPLLETHKVQVSVNPPAQPWVGALIGWLPLIALIAFFWWSMRRAGQAPNSALSFGRAKPQRYQLDRSRITFDDVADAEEAKAELQEEVDFLRHPAKYHAIGARIPKGILLAGPPGTGKTLLARAVAGEANVPFYSLSASEFVEMFVGVGASRVRDLFKQAKETAPAIILVDELDAVGRRRGAGIGTVNDEREQTLNQLLGELDGFDQRTNIIVMAATNRPDVLDPALLRPGRFDRQIVIPLPDRRGREAILRIHTRNIRLSDDVDLNIIAAGSIGMSGAELENVCNEAALGAARRNQTMVSMYDFDEALDRLRLGAAHRQVVDPEDLRIVAYHEAGHTLVAWLTQGADPVRKVTIVAHGMALGLTEQLPGQERRNLSQSYLKARLTVCLGGRVAEELVFGDITTGAENDLVQATKMARQMVTTWGMGSVGLLAYESHEAQPFLGYELASNREYSEATAARIDSDMQRLIDEAHEAARRVLDGARPQLDEIVKILLEEETVTATTLAHILGPQRSKPASQKTVVVPAPKPPPSETTVPTQTENPQAISG